MLRTAPLIVILGSTGTGKTKLSIQLARRFAGEIISADSMQVYRGLDIATAKATATEQAAAPHHLLDVAAAGHPYTVVDFRDAALPVVERLLAEQKVPIVVGGTNYYIESLLWQVLVSPATTLGDKRRRASATEEEQEAVATKRLATETESAEQKPEESGEKGPEAAERFVKSASDAQLEAKTPTQLHALLQSVDPIQAARLHPNNRRKTLRALQVFRDCGQTLSSVLAAQQAEPGGSALGGPLRYRHCILFWLRCDQAVLDERLDRRIDGMVADGLLAELRAFYDGLDEGCKVGGSFTQGILQTIGFKEFIPYLERFGEAQDAEITEHMRRDSAVAASEGAAPEGLETLQQCLEELRLVTKRYSKKQMKWVANRFVGASGRQVPPVYELDSSNVAEWECEVFARAESIVQSYLEGREGPFGPMERRESRRAGLSEDVSNVCETCRRTFVGEFQWRIHLRGNKHKRAAEKVRKAKELAEFDVVRGVVDEKSQGV